MGELWGGWGCCHRWLGALKRLHDRAVAEHADRTTMSDGGIKQRVLKFSWNKEE